MSSQPPKQKLPQKPTTPTKPITLPRAEHLTLPLSPDLRADLSARLISTGTITSLRQQLDATCAETEWKEKVQARALQLLRESGGEVGRKELGDVLVREALGGEADNDYDEGEEQGGERKVVVKVADVMLTERVREVGRRVVRDGLEGVEVEVRRELTDGWVV